MGAQEDSENPIEFLFDGLGCFDIEEFQDDRHLGPPPDEWRPDLEVALRELFEIAEPINPHDPAGAWKDMTFTERDRAITRFRAQLAIVWRLNRGPRLLDQALRNEYPPWFLDLFDAIADIAYEQGEERIFPKV